MCDSTPSDPICATNLDYNMCKNELRRDYIVATSAIALISTFLMGLFANLPLGLAPGLGGQLLSLESVSHPDSQSTPSLPILKSVST